jgi:hypothetical protein
LGANKSSKTKKKKHLLATLIVFGIGYGVSWYMFSIPKDSDGEDLFDNNKKKLYSIAGGVTLVTGKSAFPKRRSSGGSRDAPVTGRVIESRIEGEFNGWDHDAIFVLLNGQVWKQVAHTLSITLKLRPKVWIVKDGIHWVMKVDGMMRSVRVERVR